MGFFGFGRKEDIDYTEGYKRRRKASNESSKFDPETGRSLRGSRAREPIKDTSNDDDSFGFFSSVSETVSNNISNSSGDISWGNEENTSSGSDREDNDSYSSGDEKRKKLAKRLMGMTDRIEDLNNQIYHLQQRLEVLERKSGVRSFDN